MAEQEQVGSDALLGQSAAPVGERLAYQPPRITPTAARLIDWMRHPDPVPIRDGRIDWPNAMWKAAQIVDLSGIYKDRRKCLADLKLLQQLGLVERYGNWWWRIYNPSEW